MNHNMEYTILQPKKPENIALSFSGGGFRAAAYALGCISYLETIQLDSKPFMSLVSFMSSASGGTITNLSYTLSQRKKQNFSDYYRFMNDNVLNGTMLLDRVFSIMTDKNKWKDRPLKSRNLINAFSIAYDEMLFNGEKFGVYFNNQNGVREVCANATDFDNALLFRFQNVPKYGNHFLYFKPKNIDALKNIKLGDILAASSCFPVGFEPIMFPQDFTYNGLSKPELEAAIHENPVYQNSRKNSNDSINVGLMDGGIDDNQGIASFMLAEERLRTKNRFGYDLYLSCDVSSNYTSGFDFPNENKKCLLLKFSIWHYAFFIVILFILSCLGINNSVWLSFSYILAGISGFLLAILIYGSIKIFRAYLKAEKTNETIVITIIKRICLFLRLKLSVILLLLNSRMKSAGYLAAVVFLKKIRRSSYDRLLERISERKYDGKNKSLPEDSEATDVVRTELKHWRKFSIQNAIYLLSTKNNFQREITLKKEAWFKSDPLVQINGKDFKLLELMKPSYRLQQIADLATEMDTTLWYDKNHTKEGRNASIIATGQFTICYNLLRYAMRFDSSDTYWKVLQNTLAADWKRFNETPFWMYNNYGTNSPNFKSMQ